MLSRPGFALLLALASPVIAQQAPDLRPGWIADSTSGCRVWNPYPQADETVSWSGACVDGLVSGYGVLQWFVNREPSARDEGSFRGGRPNGWGKNTYRNGSRYEGEWRDGMKSGRGIFIWADGGRYDGQFFDDAINGHGVYTAADGSRRYEGTWQHNRPNGYGKATYKDGSVYEGTWSKGCFQQGDLRGTVLATNEECGFK